MLVEWINTHIIETLIILFAIMIWDLVWKLTAMWKAAKRNSKTWFILLMIINSIGILPILYLIFARDKVEEWR